MRFFTKNNIQIKAYQLSIRRESNSFILVFFLFIRNLEQNSSILTSLKTDPCASRTLRFILSYLHHCWMHLWVQYSTQKSTNQIQWKPPITSLISIFYLWIVHHFPTGKLDCPIDPPNRMSLNSFCCCKGGHGTRKFLRNHVYNFLYSHDLKKNIDLEGKRITGQKKKKCVSLLFFANGGSPPCNNPPSWPFPRDHVTVDVLFVREIYVTAPIFCAIVDKKKKKLRKHEK